MDILLGVFLLLHALVHLLYAGQALRFFELRPGLTWPDGSWAFSRLPAGQLPFRCHWLHLASWSAGWGFSCRRIGNQPAR